MLATVPCHAELEIVPSHFCSVRVGVCWARGTTLKKVPGKENQTLDQTQTQEENAVRFTVHGSDVSYPAVNRMMKAAVSLQMRAHLNLSQDLVRELESISIERLLVNSDSGQRTFRGSVSLEGIDMARDGGQRLLAFLQAVHETKRAQLRYTRWYHWQRWHHHLRGKHIHENTSISLLR